MPRPIQIAMAYDSDTVHLHRMVLCDDGSMWAWDHDGKAWGWQRLVDIPGDVNQPNAAQGPEVWR